MKPRSLSIVFAGGGTGGHLNPGIAIAQEFVTRNADSRILFMGTDRPLEASLISKAGFAHQSVTAEGLKGRGIRRQIASLLKLPRGIVESIGILKRFGPDVVIGVGSYVAGPIVIGAWLLRCNITLHEQNIVPGITNRMLGFFADRIHVSFEETRPYFNGRKLRVSGNPVRAEIIRLAETPDTTGHGHGKPFTVLITGGSQGAHLINKAMMGALAHLKERNAIFFIHQTGTDDEKMVAGVYRRYGIPCRVQGFFDDMARQFQLADLVICRAGATTVAEVAVMGKAALFIPMPHIDNHQVINARTLMEAGGADMILQEDLDGAMLMEKILYYASHPEDLERMARNASVLGKTDAAITIVDDCYGLVNGIESA